MKTQLRIAGCANTLQFTRQGLVDYLDGLRKQSSTWGEYQNLPLVEFYCPKSGKGVIVNTFDDITSKDIKVGKTTLVTILDE